MFGFALQNFIAVIRRGKPHALKANGFSQHCNISHRLQSLKQLNLPPKIITMRHKLFFILGLIFLLSGQILLAQGNEFVYNLKPIDFAHWCLLVGVVFLIPQVVHFKKSVFSTIGVPLTIVGITCMIGMCVLDFIFWSCPTDELRDQFANHLINQPTIWKPFITIGPSSKVFNLGLLILSLNYFKTSKLGVSILLLACLILWHIIPLPFRLVVGYSLTLIAFILLLFDQKLKSLFAKAQ